MASQYNKPPISLNGYIMPGDQPAIMHDERGFTLGDGVFDSMFVCDGEMQEAEAHFARLLRHYAILICPQAPETYTPPLDVATLRARAQNLITAFDADQAHLVLRTSLSAGPGGRGLKAPDTPAPTCLMAMSPAPPPASDAPVTAIIAESVRRNAYSPLSRIKSLNYGDNLIAYREAQAAGAQEAILLNTAGYVACASVGNIIMVEDGQWLTPPQTDGAMDGTQRARLIEQGMREASITTDRLREARAVYSCNCVRGVQPLELIG
jgi:branched-chain amino acid aminotransferase